MFSALWNLIFFLIAIGVLVTIHEAGHFFAARRCGVKVYRFSFGFGPVIWRHIGSDGVEYAISLIPLGGYVKMKGEPGDNGSDPNGGNGMRVRRDDRSSKKSPTEQYQDVKSYGSGALGVGKIDGDARTNASGSSAESGLDGASSSGAATGASGAGSSAGSGSGPKVIETDFAELRVGSAEDYHDMTDVWEEELAKNDSFADKSLCQRAFIIAAGPLSNFVLGFLLFMIVNMVGVESYKPIVAFVTPDTVAAEAGLESNDLVVRVNDTPVYDWSDVSQGFLIGLGDKVSVDVISDKGLGEERHVSLDLSEISVKPKSNFLKDIGVFPYFGSASTKVSSFIPDSPASNAGIEIGDTILTVNGVKVNNWYELNYELSKYTDTPVEFEVRRKDGSIFTPKFASDYVKTNDGKMSSRKYFGFVGETEYDPTYSFIREYGFFDAIGQSYDDSVRVSLLIVNSIEKLITGVISAENINGPISIAQGAGFSARLGFTSFLTFLALLSLNLGIVNLIPLPVLDGGQLMYIAYEGVTKREPSVRAQNVLTMVGLAALLFLTFLSIFNDLNNL